MNKKESRREEQGEQVKRSILTNMIVLPFIPFLLAIGVSFYFFTTALQSNTNSSLKRIVNDHRDMIESFLMERKSDLELITNTFDFEQINQKESIDLIFENLKKRSNAFIDLGLFDSHGVHVSYSGKYQLKGKDYQEEHWFKEVMHKGYYISDIFLGYRNVPHFVIAVRQGAGEDRWALRATIDTLFFEGLVSKVRIGKTGEAYILNKNGIAQTLKRSGGIQILEKDPDASEFPVPENGIQAFVKSDFTGNTYLYATTWLKNKEWLLVVRQEKKDAYESLYSALYISLIIMLIGGTVIIMAAVFMTERILKKIQQLGREKETLGHQLIRASQLAEIGEMAAGFAHEINNPLQIIKSEHALVETLMEDVFETVDPGKNEDMIDIKDSLAQIKLQVNRCAEITQAILKFGRKNETKQQPLDPCRIIPEIVQMIEKKATVGGIKFIKNISEDAPGFMGNPSQFQQVMLNLFNNAMDAIAEQHGVSGGVLNIEACKKDENFLVIKITDNGKGIRPENVEKIFSPFFTTKPVGKGTGLGLSVCYGIIKSFGGTMEVTSEQNVGTCFVVTLPAIHQ
ncbi:MAG: ATP-binding protein [Proteobacteria bacterium]|nr:GHKL domain-containing protein [Desulfobacula sp.]MBU3953865.1 ATP-binding protein [Pseudomonadota bacterium]MBU4129583.1 ATP-binding protein [Pseudomonadota bacterium]